MASAQNETCSNNWRGYSDKTLRATLPVMDGTVRTAYRFTDLHLVAEDGRFNSSLSQQCEGQTSAVSVARMHVARGNSSPDDKRKDMQWSQPQPKVILECSRYTSYVATRVLFPCKLNGKCRMQTETPKIRPQCLLPVRRESGVGVGGGSL